jgi:dipeptide/tripeptide permease
MMLMIMYFGLVEAYATTWEAYTFYGILGILILYFNWRKNER